MTLTKATVSLPPETAHRGSLRLLEEPLTALFCSSRCPGDLILKTYDLARAMRDAGVPVIGGFQTPMEKECLRLLLRGSQPVVVCPARGIENMRVPRDWRGPLKEDRMLVLSPFPHTADQRRSSQPNGTTSQRPSPNESSSPTPRQAARLKPSPASWPLPASRC